MRTRTKMLLTDELDNANGDYKKALLNSLKSDGLDYVAWFIVESLDKQYTQETVDSIKKLGGLEYSSKLTHMLLNIKDVEAKKAIDFMFNTLPLVAPAQILQQLEYILSDRKDYKESLKYE